MFRAKAGHPIYMCGEDIDHFGCNECGFAAYYLCDFPVDEGKTCDAGMCEQHFNIVSIDIHYCERHFTEWQAFVESGGVEEELKKVMPLEKKYQGKYNSEVRPSRHFEVRIRTRYIIHFTDGSKKQITHFGWDEGLFLSKLYRHFTNVKKIDKKPFPRRILPSADCGCHICFLYGQS